MIRVLFVCTGNICRSPTAEGIARSMAEARGLAHLFHFDSAGTHGYHVGDPPDRRTIKAAAQRGYPLDALRARAVSLGDFAQFDHLLALDRGHLAWMTRQCPPQFQGKLRLLMSFAPQANRDEVPDPYYGSADDFERVLDLVEEAVAGLLDGLASETRSSSVG